jgi:hypothetical protein
VYELLGLRSDSNPECDGLIQASATALDCYRRRDWPNAIRALDEALLLRAGDPPSLLLRSRCKEFELNPPGLDWTAMHSAEAK